MAGFKAASARLFCFGLWLVLLPAAPPGAAGPDAAIALAAEDPERVVACLPLKAGEPFHLDYINSIYLQPVRETFLHEPGEGLYITRVETPSAGVFAYLDLIPDQPGKASLRRKLGDIRLLSSDYQNHRLTAGATELRIKGLIPDGRPVILRVLNGRPCPP